MCKSMETHPFLQYLKQGILMTYNLFSLLMRSCPMAMQ